MQEFIGYAAAGIGIFFALAAALSIVALAFSAISLPLLLIVAGIALVVAAFIALWNHSDEIIDAIKSGWDAIGEWFSSLWDDIKSGVEAFGQFFVDLWDSIVQGVVDAFMWLYNHNYYFKMLVDKIVSLFNKAKSFVLNIWNTISKYLSDKWNAIKTKASEIFESIKNKISDIWSSISSTIQGWASKAYEWGANFLQMLINGIKSKVSAIIDTVKGIGSKIAGFLGFHSPTDKGPLSSSDQWMPNFMNMLEQGLEAGIPKLEMAVGDVAATIATADTIAGASSSVTNNINVSSRQNTLDERGLGRMLERMRILNGGAF
jgi:phage-related protein